MHKLGDYSYDNHDFGTAWWLERAQDKAHQAAYKRIVKYSAKFLDKEPKHVIDYACGPGMLLRYLRRQFPESRISAIDESEQAIIGARDVLRRSRLDPDDKHIHFVQDSLPHFNLGLRKADIVYFCFPDFRIPETRPVIKYWREQFPQDWDATKKLRQKLLRDGADPELLDDNFDCFRKRLAGRNLRQMVKRGGLMLRVDYGSCSRDECEENMLKQIAFCEGSLCRKRWDKDTRKDLVFAELLDSVYVPSAVINDVYAQTGNSKDTEGGFFISVLRAV